MKKAKDYIKKYSFYGKIPTRELEAIIKQAQIEAYNEALKDAVKNVKLEEVSPGIEYDDINSISNDMGDVYCISKQSILKLKK